MADARNDLPGDKSANFSQRVRETLMTYMGRQGDPLDRGLTLRDLLDAGVIALKGGFNLSGGLGRGTLPIVPVAPGTEYVEDLTPPPTPTGFTASAAISNLLLQCDPQVYTQGHGHLKTVIYGAIYTSGAPPTFTDALKITEFSGTVHAYPTNPATEWHLWAKWMTVDGVLSTSPAGGTNGVVATTGQDVALLLAALTGKLTESQLFSSLGARINLIDAPITGLVARVTATETATAGYASASVVTQVQARLDTGDFAAVKAESSASASSITGLYAKHEIKIDLAGLISGYGLASTASIDATPTSAFGVLAGQFFVGPPALAQTVAPTVNIYDGFVWLDTSVTPNVTRYYKLATTSWVLQSPALPFIIQATPTTINGQFVPPGMYVPNAYMGQLVATRGQIGLLAVDDARIASMAVDKLIAGSLAVGQYIQSTIYTPGSVGWRINANGTAELANAIVRGTVYATAGLIGGNTIDASGIQSANYAAGSSGWRLGMTGAEFGAADIRGQLTAGQIDTRGLSIKDALGTVILASGTALNWSFITPSSAWLNSNVTYAGLADAKPPFNADHTADNTALGILNQGALATASSVTIGTNVTLPGYGTLGTTDFVNRLSKIGTVTISTFMDDLAIGNAYIGNAAVSTLKIGPQEVTFPRSNWVAGIVLFVDAAWVNLVSVTGTFTGAPVHLVASCFVVGSSYHRNMSLRLMRGTTLVQTALIGNPDGFMTGFTVQALDTPPAGSQTYYLQGFYNKNGSAYTAESSCNGILALETKR